MRTTKEVFENHLILTLDWEQEQDILKNYAQDCVLLTSFGIFKGHEGVKSFLELMNTKIPDADYLYLNQLCDGDVAFLEWQVESSTAIVDDGAETFLIKDGLIIAHTIHCTIRQRCS
jgi:hypothetical protein